MDVGVVLESGAEVTFKSVPAGSFLPILVKRVSSAPTATGDIIALYQSMWFGIGYLVPQKTDTAGEPRPLKFLIETEDALFEMQTEDGSFVMELELTTE